MYCGVPSDMPVSVIRAAAAFDTASAMPKSATSAWPLVQQDVLRLDVAMDDAVPVRVVERVGDLASRCAPRRRCGSCFSRSSRSRSDLALDERHDVEDGAVGRPRVEQRQDVRMLQVRRRLDLAQEPLGADARRRAPARSTLIATWRSCLRSCGEVDGGHAAGAELALDAVAVGETCTEARDVVVHSSARKTARLSNARQWRHLLMASRSRQCRLVARRHCGARARPLPRATTTRQHPTPGCYLPQPFRQCGASPRQPVP